VSYKRGTIQQKLNEAFQSQLLVLIHLALYNFYILRFESN